MDWERAGFRFLESALRRAINDLRRAVEATASAETNPSKLTDYVVAALAAIEARGTELNGRFDGTVDPPERDALTRELRHLNSYVRRLNAAIPWLESIRSPSLSLGLMFYINEASRVLIGPDTDLVLHRGAAYNYSTFGLRALFEPVVARLSGTIPAGPSPVVVIYPRVEEDRTLLYPIFVHELGHEAVERNGLLDLVKGRHPNKRRLNRRSAEVIELVVEEERGGSEAISEPEAALQVRARLDSWLEEILCDNLALAYLGPSYVFAAASFLLPTSSAVPSSTHPPPPLRVALLLSHMDRLGWRPLLEDQIPNIMAWLDATAASDQPDPTDVREMFAREVVADLTDPLRDVAVEVVGEIFGPANYTPVASQLQERLEHHIPPIQLDKDQPAGRREILLASWLYCFGLERLGDEPATLQGALAEVELQQFFATTLEMSFVLEQWRAA